MKIMNRITLRYLKENKKRTILTILCITFSVIMISCVGIGFSSVKDYFMQYTLKTEGDYHFTIIDNDTKTIDIIKKDKETKDYYFSRSTTNAYQETNINTKYGDQRYFEKKNLNDYLLRGTLPQNKHQIVLSQRFLDTLKTEKTIGDTIELTDLENDDKITYSICGIMKFLPSEVFGQSMDALSYIDLENHNNYYTMYVEEKTLSTDIFNHIKELENQIAKIKKASQEVIDNAAYHVDYNSSYLALNNIFEYHSSSTFLTVYKLGGFILGIIILVSVFIIYQAFNLSTFERVSYLGMLSSVGATRKQKMKSVYFEGLILSIIAIPLGILCSFIGLATAFHYINQFDLLRNLDIYIHTTIEPLYLLAVIVLSLFTIFISLYLPARKVSRISVIDALKNKEDVKVKANKLKTRFFSRDIYKQLALKNYKRQGKRSRVIVLSLSISIIAFISVYSFGKNMLQVSDSVNDTNPYDVEVYTSSSDIEKIDNYLKHNESVKMYNYNTEIMLDDFKIDSSYLKDKTIYQDRSIHIYGIESENYKKLCQVNNINQEKNQALIINGEYIDDNEKKIDNVFRKMDKNFIQSMFYKEVDYDDDGNEIEINHTDFPTFNDIELIDNDYYHFSSYYHIVAVVPIDYLLSIDLPYVQNITFQIQTDEDKKVSDTLEMMGYYPNNIAEIAENEKNQREFFMIVEIFIYGFVIVMIVFSFLNILNMMSASIEKRKKEFGMMLSVGMSNKGIHKMILFECLLYGVKTLLYSIPLSVIIEVYMFDIGYGSASDVTFTPSYMAYFVSFVVIVLIMVSTFELGLSRFKKQNIIETLKDDM